MFSKIKDSLVGKIMLGYAGIVVLAIVTTLVSVFSALQNTSTDKLVAEAYYPTILSLKQTEMLASESVGLTNNLLSSSSGKGKETHLYAKACFAYYCRGKNNERYYTEQQC